MFLQCFQQYSDSKSSSLPPPSVDGDFDPGGVIGRGLPLEM